MSTKVFQRASFLLSVAALTIGFNSVSAQAQTVTTDSATSIEAQESSLQAVTPDAAGNADSLMPSLVAQSNNANPATSTTGASPSTTVSPEIMDSGTMDSGTMAPSMMTPGMMTPGTTTSGEAMPMQSTPSQVTTETAPVEGASSSAADLSSEEAIAPSATPAEGSGSLIPSTEPPQTAQGTSTPDTSPIQPGRATRSGPSYIGVGGNIGLGDGDTALGEGSFAVFSKIGLTSNISVRPAVLFSDDPTILLPVTFDFIPGVTDLTEDISGELGLRVSPFIGAGAAISTGDDSSVDFLVTGGVDVPLGNRFSATATVNATFFDNVAVGLLIGVGYNF